MAAVTVDYDPSEHAWKGQARCSGVGPDPWFRGRGESIAEAKKVCAGCSVRDECLEYALENRITHGIWGGTSERERRRLRRSRRQSERVLYAQNGSPVSPSPGLPEDDRTQVPGDSAPRTGETVTH